MALEHNVAPVLIRDAPSAVEMAILVNDIHTGPVQGHTPPTRINTVYEPQIPWHPKITPYRLSNLLIPLFVGTAKAVASLRGSSTAPIALEWISGVVVFLLLFHAGCYESGESPPKVLAWAFQTDCMEYLWRFLQFFSIARPRYRSDEHLKPESIATSHHLFVSATFVFCGLTKAILTNANLSVWSVWIEWTVAGVITSVSVVIFKVPI
ncbi:hypothetical protein GALMADRAFT_162416 [Galerina marginata CBS 339.88]|uniref:Uncharacterized protein n=1 Tax=Galerina marginata (strain CBS 339.88) TaxID=685588 RepID=A0A067S4A8_GALM3|nr:hypothetical protein GALMADRAFT_162416 [Galerina marginata CBS 339.88]